LERTAFTTRQVLSAAKLEWKDISRLLLVGGSTRMPMVAEMLKKASGLDPEKATTPDDGVARGAALFGGFLLAAQEAYENDETETPAAVKVTDVNSHSLGMQGVGQKDRQPINSIVIPRNTSLPATVTRKFVTKADGQTSIVIQILEGESKDPTLCSVIGRSVLRGLPGDLPQGYPVDVHFEYATNGRLNILATVPGTGRELIIELVRAGGMTDERRNRWQQLFEKSAEGPAFEDLLDEVLGLED
jgi:molecular chaperone DnaK